MKERVMLALIYVSSGFHWKGDGTGKKRSVPNREYSRWGLNLCPCASWRWSPDERFIDSAVAAYAQVFPNLRVHNPNYPTPAELQSKIRWGNVEFDGDISQDTPGSDLIKAVLLGDEPGPVYLLAWGGQSTIARALQSIQVQYSATPEWPAVYEKVSRKAVLSPSGDQDDTYATYIHPNWPDIRILPAGVRGVALGYEAHTAVSVEDSVYYSTAWTRANVSSRGAFGALYRVWGDGKQMVQATSSTTWGFRVTARTNSRPKATSSGHRRARRSVPRCGRHVHLPQPDRQRTARIRGRDAGRLGRTWGRCSDRGHGSEPAAADHDQHVRRLAQIAGAGRRPPTTTVT